MSNEAMAAAETKAATDNAKASPESNGRVLSAEEILRQSDLRYKKVYAPSWKTDVYVHELSAHNRRKFRRLLIKDAQSEEVKVPSEVFAVAHSLRDAPNGELLFTERQMEQLSQKAGEQIERLAEVVIDLSGMRSTGIVKVLRTVARYLHNGRLTADEDVVEKLKIEIDAALTGNEPDNDPTEEDAAGN